MMSCVWIRAVWLEGDTEVEEVIPSTWVKYGKVLWPKVSRSGAIKAINERWEPASNWDKFQLIKVKISSGM